MLLAETGQYLRIRRNKEEAVYFGNLRKVDKEVSILRATEWEEHNREAVFKNQLRCDFYADQSKYPDHLCRQNDDLDAEEEYLRAYKKF